jgi:hypothetical protein
MKLPVEFAVGVTLVDLKETGCEVYTGFIWLRTDKQWALVNTKMNLLVKKKWYFLTSQVTITFSGRTMLHMVR